MAVQCTVSIKTKKDAHRAWDFFGQLSEEPLPDSIENWMPGAIRDGDYGFICQLVTESRRSRHFKERPRAAKKVLSLLNDWAKSRGRKRVAAAVPLA